MYIRILTVSLSYLGIAILTSLIGFAHGWRGIKPLHSVRADVERLLGQPTNPNNKYSVFYNLENETVTFDYAGGPPCDGTNGWQVPEGTVMKIAISPRKRLQLSELNIEVSRYKKINHEAGPGSIEYINDENGESIETFYDDVTRITYFPTVRDNHLRCVDTRGASEGERYDHGLHTLDIYGNIPFEDEKSRLDNFAIHLQRQSEAKGYIIVYAGQRARIGEARARAKRAKNYLMYKRGIRAGRVVTLDGGYREESTVNLYLVPRGATGPTPSPTLDPREVQIIRGGNANINKRRSYRPRR